MLKIFARERFFIKLESLSKDCIEALKKRYTYNFFEEKACAKCEWVDLRRKQGALGECEVCAAYLGSTLLANRVKIKNTVYLATPIGDFSGLTKILNKFGYTNIVKKELHKIIPIQPIHFTGKLRDYQKEAVAACIRGEKGVLEAPPRSGKCIVGDTLIMTENGLTPIENLFPSKFELSKKLEFSQVASGIVASNSGASKYECLYAKTVSETIAIETHLGYSIEGTPEHPVLVRGAGGKIEWKELRNISISDTVCISLANQWLPKEAPKFSFLSDACKSFFDDRKTALPLLRFLGKVQHAPLVAVESRNEKVYVSIYGMTQMDALDHAQKLKVFDPEVQTDRLLDEDDECSEDGALFVFSNNSILEILQSFKKNLVRGFPKGLLSASRCYVAAYLKGIFDVPLDDPLSNDVHEQLQCKRSILFDKSFAKALQVVLTYFGYLFHLDEDAWKNDCDEIKACYTQGLHFSRIKSIRYSAEKQKTVYDIYVPRTHAFIANGIVSHNTVMLADIVCELGVKSLLVASQVDWLQGFYETFVGSDTQKPLTDLSKERIGFCTKLSDFDKYDVCLATIQTFHSTRGQALLKALRDKFTLVGIDEVHTSAATKYLSEISKFNCKYKIGLTGTPDRKDGRYPLTSDVVGPILYEAKVERLRPIVKCVRTGFSNASKTTIWAYIVRKIENDKKRLEVIADCAVKDAEAGHVILIPFAQTKPIASLVELINKRAGKVIAKPFTGKLKSEERAQLIQDAREKRIKVIVGTSSILSTGINIPSASALYDVTPSSNVPQATQRMSRILTPCKDKPQPILRYFLDDDDVRKACMRKEFWSVAVRAIHAIVPDREMEILKSYFSSRVDSFNSTGKKW